MDMVANGCITKQGYRALYIRSHPLYPKATVVLEHRFVMECFLGRRLTSKDVVHHKDENRLNNNISNLELMDRAGHALHHAAWEGKHVQVACICQHCGVTKLLQPNLAKRNKYCSEACRLEALHEGLRAVRASTPCLICGTMIEQGRYTKRYCSETCRALGRGQAVSTARQKKKAS